MLYGLFTLYPFLHVWYSNNLKSWHIGLLAIYLNMAHAMKVTFTCNFPHFCYTLFSFCEWLIFHCILQGCFSPLVYAECELLFVYGILILQHIMYSLIFIYISWSMLLAKHTLLCFGYIVWYGCLTASKITTNIMHT